MNNGRCLRKAGLISLALVSIWLVAMCQASGQVLVPEWHIDFQGDANHGGTYGQAGPVAHSQPGVYWNVFSVPALKEPWPTPHVRKPSMALKDARGNPTTVTFTLEAPAYGWAGLPGADSLLGDYLIFMLFSDFGVSNNPAWWKISGLEPDTRYCLTFYHAISGGRGLVFGVLHAAYTTLVLVEGTAGRNAASECVTSSGEGTITGWVSVAVSTQHCYEGNWAGLTIRAEAQPREHSVSVPNAPSGPSEGEVGKPLSFTFAGATCSQGHRLEYQFDWGDGTSSAWIDTLVPGTHAWTKEGTYQVKCRARCSEDKSVISAWSPATPVSIRSAPPPPPAHTVSAPPAPSGPSEGEVGQTLTFSLPYGITCNQGHPVDYQFDWGDGTSTGWGPLGPVAPSHAWAQPGTYHVKARARCTKDPHVVSAWSAPKTVTIRKALTLFPKQDVTVKSGASYENKNFGRFSGYTELGAQYTGSRESEERTLIQFDTSAIPFGAKILSVKLRMALRQTHSEFRNYDVISLYRVSGPWTDTTVTWETQPKDPYVPGVRTPPDAFINLKGRVDAWTWVEWDLTEAVARAGFPPYGWLVVGGRRDDWGHTSSHGVATFVSSEGGDPTTGLMRAQGLDLRPRLVIVYTQ